ncbi:pili assembly chaperone [Vibrio sp. RE86]|uniref:type IV pilus modification PilV family protein n=1 Tax=Vibrio sp. RE86 TaxID=2607605 RepID=UPI003462AC56
MVVNSKVNGGFTLIENIIAICLMGFLMLAFSAFLAPQAVTTADTLTQQRASQIANLLLKEMYARPFDEVNIERLGRCDTDCTAANALQSEVGEGNLRDDFDDYDTQNQWVDIEQYALFLDGPYEGFAVNINVEYVDQDWNPVNIVTSSKHVEIQARRGDNGQVLEFHAYRSNF